MAVLITGATGLVGKALVADCMEKKIQVHYLTTSKHKIEQKPLYKGFYWDPSKNHIDTNAFKGVTTIINLAGATIAKRWTPTYKKEVIHSRLDSLSLLHQSLTSLKDHTIERLITASAIGIYPNSLTEFYKEDQEMVDASFLGEVTKKWEAQANVFKAIGIRVSTIRIGIVLDAYQGALPKMIQPVKYGVGAVLGSGEQWQSWIHIQDLTGVFMHVLSQDLEGVYNAVAPNATTNRDITKQIARILHRKIVLPAVPRFIMEFILGEMALLVFSSQRVSSEKIQAAGYRFKFTTISQALEDLL